MLPQIPLSQVQDLESDVGYGPYLLLRGLASDADTPPVGTPTSDTDTFAPSSQSGYLSLEAPSGRLVGLGFSPKETEGVTPISCRVIGRSSVCSLRIDHDTVSKAHGFISMSHLGWFLRDYGSKNGTWINGTRVGSDPCRVKDGDHVMFGEVPTILLSKETAEQLIADLRS